METCSFLGRPRPRVPVRVVRPQDVRPRRPPQGRRRPRQTEVHRARRPLAQQRLLQLGGVAADRGLADVPRGQRGERPVLPHILKYHAK